jgi:hypothetical protein
MVFRKALAYGVSLALLFSAATAIYCGERNCYDVLKYFLLLFTISCYYVLHSAYVCLLVCAAGVSVFPSLVN